MFCLCPLRKIGQSLYGLLFWNVVPNGVRLAQWVPALCLDKLDNQGGDGEAVQPEK